MRIFLLSVIISFLFSNLYCQLDEDALFGDDSIIENNTIIKKDIEVFTEKESVGFSGNVNSFISYSINRDFLLDQHETNFNKNSFSSGIKGNGLLDIRLKNGIKSFINLQIQYGLPGYNISHNYYTYTNSYTNIGTVIITNPVLVNQTFYETNSLIIDLQEFFIDFNFNNLMYFRIGKQVLQWGRGYFWNPTDLINKEAKNFFNISGYRSGNYGLKLHIPYKTLFNFYSYLNFMDANNIDDISGAIKFEVLLDFLKTEMSVSAWMKKNYRSVFGFDFSSRVPFINLNLYGESSFSYGENISRVKREETNFTVIVFNITNYFTNTNYIVYTNNDKWCGEFSIGFGRSFDIFDNKNALTINTELYYNPYGYKENIFEDKLFLYHLSKNNGYKYMRSSTLYLALFLTVNKFILSDINLNVNTIGNLDDNSYIVSTGLSYTGIDKFNIGFNVNFYIGETNREFTYNNNSLSISFNSSLQF